MKIPWAKTRTQLSLFHPRLQLPTWSALPTRTKEQAISLLTLLLHDATKRAAATDTTGQGANDE